MGNTKAWAGMCQIGMGFVLALGLALVFTATVFADGPQPDLETYEVSAFLCATAPDIHESDNFYTEATVIPTNRTVQTHTFHVVADKDWASFHALAGQVYTVTTSQLSSDVDTVLQLYDTDGVTLLQENDDYLPGSKSSRIVWMAPTDGLYYARMAHFDRTFDPRTSPICGSEYLITVETNACKVAPDIYESNSFYTEATVIPADGTVQTHTFHVVADKDWVGFHALAGQVYTVTTSQLSGDVDTVLQLYDTDGVSLLDENDDYLLGSKASRIVWTAPADGRYYARVTHFDRTFDPRTSSVCGSQYLVAVDHQQVLKITNSGRDLNDEPLRSGDAVEYTIAVWNTISIVQTNVVITNPIPLHTTYVTGSVQATQGGILGLTPLVIAVGNVEAGERVTVTFQVTVDPSSGGQMIVNQALARSGQQNGVIYSTHATERVVNCLYLPFVARGSTG